MKNVFVIGSTGTLGSKLTSILKLFPSEFRIIGLVGYKNVDLLCNQVKEFDPQFVGLSREFITPVENNFPRKRVFAVESGLSIAIEEANPDIVAFLSNSITTLRAIKASLDLKKRVLIANKESILAGGELLLNNETRELVVPIDSESCAIFQCLVGERIEDVEKIILTASGGPFYGRSLNDLKEVTASQALKHPKWKMGSKITIDSANLVNKAFEVIENHFLFDIPYESIEVVIHPESVVHSLVQFRDRQLKAVLSIPDMSYPIYYSLFYPERVRTDLPELQLTNLKDLHFYELEEDSFPAFSTVVAYGREGGNYLPCIVGIDEELVSSFIKGQIKFTEIGYYLEKLLGLIEPRKLASLDEVEDWFNYSVDLTRRLLRREI